MAYNPNVVTSELKTVVAPDPLMYDTVNVEGELLVNGVPVTAGAGGTVTEVSASSNTFIVEVQDPTTTPLITIEIPDIVQFPSLDVSGSFYPPQASMASLPSASDFGKICFVTNANSGAGTICFSNGVDWIDVKTGAAVV